MSMWRRAHDRRVARCMPQEESRTRFDGPGRWRRLGSRSPQKCVKRDSAARGGQSRCSAEMRGFAESTQRGSAGSTDPRSLKLMLCGSVTTAADLRGPLNDGILNDRNSCLGPVRNCLQLAPYFTLPHRFGRRLQGAMSPMPTVHSRARSTSRSSAPR